MQEIYRILVHPLGTLYKCVVNTKEYDIESIGYTLIIDLSVIYSQS